MSLVVLDLDLPDGLSALGELREQHPAIPVVIISGAQDYNIIIRALNLGARGFILKSEQRQIMLSALELVFAGGIYIPREILAVESFSALKTGASRCAANGRPRKLAELGLTGRQLDVLRAMMKGKCNKAICRELNPRRADGEKPRHRNSQTARGAQPSRGSGDRRGLGLAAD